MASKQLKKLAVVLGFAFTVSVCNAGNEAVVLLSTNGINGIGIVATETFNLNQKGVSEKILNSKESVSNNKLLQKTSSKKITSKKSSVEKSKAQEKQNENVDIESFYDESKEELDYIKQIDICFEEERRIDKEIDKLMPAKGNPANEKAVDDLRAEQKEYDLKISKYSSKVRLLGIKRKMKVLEKCGIINDIVEFVSKHIKDVLNYKCIDFSNILHKHKTVFGKLEKDGMFSLDLSESLLFRGIVANTNLGFKWIQYIDKGGHLFSYLERNGERFETKHGGYGRVGIYKYVEMPQKNK